MVKLNGQLLRKVFVDGNEVSISDFDFVFGTKFCAFDLTGADSTIHESKYNEHTPVFSASENTEAEKKANAYASVIPRDIFRTKCRSYRQ